LSSLPRRIFSIFSLPRRLLTSHSFAALPSLHSFPTRRSSDLFLARRRADVDFATTQGLDWRGGAVLGWSGMRGVVTLAAAQTLPRDLPYRPQLVLVAFTVAFVTLLLQGGTLPAVIRWLQVRGGGAR